MRAAGAGAGAPGGTGDAVKPEPAAKPLMEFVCAYDYCDEFGQVRFQKFRYRTNCKRGKTFRYFRQNGKPGKPRGADALPYRLPELLQALRSGRKCVYITEGEKDCLSVVEAGGVATSPHQGAEQGPDSEQCKWFAGYGGRVYVLADNDPAGYRCAQWWLEGLVKYAGLAPAQIRFRVARVGKDVSDHLAAGYRLSDMRKVSKATVREKAQQQRDELAARRGGYWYPRGNA